MKSVIVEIVDQNLFSRYFLKVDGSKLFVSKSGEIMGGIKFYLNNGKEKGYWGVHDPESYKKGGILLKIH